MNLAWLEMMSERRSHSCEHCEIRTVRCKGRKRGNGTCEIILKRDNETRFKFMKLMSHIFGLNHTYAEAASLVWPLASKIHTPAMSS